MILLEDLVALVAVVGLQLAASAEDKRVEPQVQESLPQVQPAGSRAHTSSGRPQVSPEETNFSETSMMSISNQYPCLNLCHEVIKNQMKLVEDCLHFICILYNNIVFAGNITLTMRPKRTSTASRNMCYIVEEEKEF